MLAEVDICRCCGAKRKALDKEPRLLVRIMVSDGFRKRAEVTLCEFCDGPTIRLAAKPRE